MPLEEIIMGDFLIHYNHNHDPNNGRFTFGSGGRNGSVKKGERYWNKVQKEAMLAARRRTGNANEVPEDLDYDEAEWIVTHRKEVAAMNKASDTLNKKITRRADQIYKTRMKERAAMRKEIGYMPGTSKEIREGAYEEALAEIFNNPKNRELVRKGGYAYKYDYEGRRD